MQMRFAGTYTNGRKTITIAGATFEGHEWQDVDGAVADALANNVEFESRKGKPGRKAKDEE